MTSAPWPHIVVRGSGDVGSAVAHHLFQAGYAVVLHDGLQPTTTRRKMAFTDAIFTGQAQLEGVTARRTEPGTDLNHVLAERQFLPVMVIDLFSLLQMVRPTILIDARLRKHHPPEIQRGLAPLTLGLGPNFIAGQTTDWAIETQWGPTLGQLVKQGATAALAGEPRPLAGHGRDRYVYAPVAGLFQTTYDIGDKVEAGQVIATIDHTPLAAPLTGVLRGLTHDGVPVSIKTKVIEIDPRGNPAAVTGLGERPRSIADGVLVAVQQWLAKQ